MTLKSHGRQDKLDAIIYSHDYVKNRLKAPATADFPSGCEGMVKQLDDSTFYVHSYVDADNSFGAKLRMYYTCKMVFYSDDTHQCFDLTLTE